MLVTEKSTGTCVEVVPYYLYGRIVAYVGKLYEQGTVLSDKHAYLPDEIEF